jgi:hypothetical protein
MLRMGRVRVKDETVGEGLKKIIEGCLRMERGERWGVRELRGWV